MRHAKAIAPTAASPIRINSPTPCAGFAWTLAASVRVVAGAVPSATTVSSPMAALVLALGCAVGLTDGSALALAVAVVLVPEVVAVVLVPEVVAVVLVPEVVPEVVVPEVVPVVGA